MSQKSVFLIAERFLFGKSGGSKTQSDQIRHNLQQFRVAFTDDKDTKKILRTSFSKTIIAAYRGRGWQHRTSGQLSAATFNGQQSGQVHELAMYGRPTSAGFKITDWRLKNLWDAIVRFASENATKLALKGAHQLQQASLLVLLSRRYQRYATAQLELHNTTTLQAAEDAKNIPQREREAAAQAAAAEELFVAQEKAHETFLASPSPSPPSLVDEKLQSALADLSLDDWDDAEEDEEQKVAAKRSELEAIVAAHEANKSAPTTPPTMLAPEVAPTAPKKKKKKKKKKSHQVRKMEASKKAAARC